MFVFYSPSNPSLELLFLLDQVDQSRAATVALTVTWSWVVMTFTIIFKSVGEAATFYLLFFPHPWPNSEQSLNAMIVLVYFNTE